MTDKEKLDKLVAEIERLIGDYNIKTEKYRGLNEQAHQYYGGKRDALSEILKSIGTMQKECIYSKDNYTDEDRKVLCEGCNEECRFNKKEELVSEEFEKEIKMYLHEVYDRDTTVSDVAKHFANWQKEQDKQWIAENHKHIFAKGYDEGVDAGRKLGKAVMKQQMMKEVMQATKIFGGIAHNSKTGQLVSYTEYKIILDDKLCGGRDKLKIIIIKED